MRFIGIIGLLSLLLLAYSFSNNRKAIQWQTVYWGLGLQVSLALLILGVPSLGFDGPLRPLFDWANGAVVQLLQFTEEGSRFLFGDLMTVPKSGFIFAVQVLPTIIFFSSLVSIGYHIGLLQKVIALIAAIMRRTMKTSGAESLSASANIFVGQTEAPLLIKPFLPKLTSSELFAVMTGGMATVAGGVLAAFVGLLQKDLPSIAGHLLTASVMSAPAALLISKIIFPETDQPETQGSVPKSVVSKDINIIEAAARGAGEGVKLAINVGGMLLAFIALIAMLNAGIGFVGQWIGFSQWGAALTPDVFLQEGKAVLSIQLILGWLFSPMAWLMGIPWEEAITAGAFLGEKVTLNEFVAYLHLSEVSGELSQRTLVILSYALCGFANFSSIAIQIGGIGSLAPERRSELADLGIRAVIGGSIAAFMTATIAGLLV